MNIENVGLSFAKVVDKDAKKSKKKPVILSIEDDSDKVREQFDEYQVDKPLTLQLIPSKERERDVLYIVGASGSGKSFYANKFISEYHLMYPKRPIFLFSVFDDDKSLTSKNITKIKLDDKFINTELMLEDFAESLIFFDDIDAIRNKVLKEKLRGILGNLLELGRHHKVSVIYISHICCKGHETQRILNEATSITFFPKTLPPRSSKYLLEQYYGLDKAQIQRIKKLKSRSITLLRSYPPVLLAENEAFVIKDMS